jgi:aminoglycoside/choline kinase family phosphotransferase
LNPDSLDVIDAAFSFLADSASEQPRAFVHRDYHSRNLLVADTADAVDELHRLPSPAIIDFQDAVIGPVGYDVASLLQDARVDVPDSLEHELFARYVGRRAETDSGFDPAGFGALYSVMAAQRATKILGIFARLDRRDGKPQYLRHMPRVWRNLQRALAHPALGGLSEWYKDNVPAFDGL